MRPCTWELKKVYTCNKLCKSQFVKFRNKFYTPGINIACKENNKNNKVHGEGTRWDEKDIQAAKFEQGKEN